MFSRIPRTSRSKHARTIQSIIELAVAYALIFFAVAGQLRADDDPTGFVGLLNSVRIQHGLRPVRYHAGAAQAAARNNQIQAVRGVGHWYLGGYGQCAGYGQRDARAFLDACLGSPSHRGLVLAGDLAYVGYAGSGLAHTVSTWQGAIAAPVAAIKRCPTCGR